MAGKDFLRGRTNKDASHIDGLDDRLADRLAQMMQDPDAPQGLGVFSGYRIPMRQAEIIRDNARRYGLDGKAWWADVQRLGAQEAGKAWAPEFKRTGMSKWYGKPGGSRHQHGTAADLSWNGSSLKRAPKEVRDWVKTNAERFGLTVPMDHEPWHIETTEARGRTPGQLAESSGGSRDASGEYRPYVPAIADRGVTTPGTTRDLYDRMGAPSGPGVSVPLNMRDRIGVAMRSTLTSDLATYVANQNETPDMDWLKVTDVTKYGKALEGLNDDEQTYIMQNAMNASHVEVLRGQLDQARRDAAALEGSWGTWGLAAAANLADPAGLAVAGPLGKGVISVSNSLRASASAGLLARTAEAGVIGAGEASVATAVQSQVDPNTDLTSFGINALGGFALGGLVGTIGRAGRVDNATAEAQAFFGRKAREMLRTKAEVEGYKVTPKGEATFSQPTQGGSIGAAVNPDAAMIMEGRTMSERAADWLLDKASPDVLLRTRAGASVADIYKRIMPELSGTGGREFRQAESAWEMSTRGFNADMAKLNTLFNKNLDDYAKEMGLPKVPVFQREAMSREFATKVDAFIRDPSIEAPSAAVRRQVETHREFFADLLKRAKESGAEWAKDIPEDGSYAPFMYNKAAYYRTVARVGRDGLIDAVKQMFARAQPDLARYTPTKTTPKNAPKATPNKGKGMVRYMAVGSTRPKVVRLDSDINISKTLAAKSGKARIWYLDLPEGHPLLTGKKLTLDDAWRKRLKPYVTKGESLKDDPQWNPKGKKADPKKREDKLERLATRFVETIERTKIDNLSAERMAALNGESEVAIRKMLQDAGAGEDEIVDFLSAFGFTQKSGPQNFRGRAVLERNMSFIPAQYQGYPNAQDYAVSLRDLIEQDIRKTSEIYAQRVNAHVALTKAGYRSEAELRKAIEEATTFRNLVEKTPEGQNVLESDLDAARRELNAMADRLLGYSQYTGWSPKARLMLNIAKQVNFVRFMQQTGIASLGDAPNVLLRFGVSRAWSQFKLGSLAEIFVKNPKQGDELAREMQMVLGMGMHVKSKRLYATLGDLNLEDEVFEQDWLTTGLLRTHTYLESASRLTANIGGLNPVTDFMQLWASKSAVRFYFDVASGRQVLSERMMNEYGISDSLLREVRAIMSHADIDENGIVRRINPDKQRAVSREHADAFDRFMGLVARETNLTVINAKPNAVYKIMSHPLASLFLQFKTFMFNSLAVSTTRAIKLGPKYGAMSLLMGSTWGALVYMTQQYLNATGRDDREKFLKERMTLDGLLAAGFSRSAVASVFPMMIDSALGLASMASGEDLRQFTNARSSGLGADLITGTPVIRTINDIGELVGGLGAAAFRTDQRFDQREAYLLSTMIPLLRSAGIIAGTNALIGTAPPDRDGALIPTGRR